MNYEPDRKASNADWLKRPVGRADVVVIDADHAPTARPFDAATDVDATVASRRYSTTSTATDCGGPGCWIGGTPRAEWCAACNDAVTADADNELLAAWRTDARRRVGCSCCPDGRHVYGAAAYATPAERRKADRDEARARNNGRAR